MNFKIEDRRLTIFPEGMIDANKAPEFDAAVSKIIGEHADINGVTIDADALTYISSSGLRVLMKLSKKFGRGILLQNASKDVYDILEMTGFVKIFDVKKKLRRVDISRCKQVGVGLSSKVYRLNEDTIIKVYDKNVPLYKITREIDLAKKAFLAGLPTAISFDLVNTEQGYGVVFEMIADALTVGDALMRDNGREFDAIMDKFAALMTEMHRTETAESDGFPSIKGTWLEWAEGMRAYYNAAEVEMLKEMIDSVPTRRTIVHCDFHAGNTLYQDGKIVVIDMADVGYAHPVFDFAAGAFHVTVRDQKSIQGALSLSEEYIGKYYDALLRKYFAADGEKLDFIKETFDAFARLRAAVFPMKHVQIPEERKLSFVAKAREDFFPNFAWAKEMVRRLPELFPEG